MDKILKLFSNMRPVLVVVAGLSAFFGVVACVGAGEYPHGNSYGAAAGGLFVCLGFCLYSLTKLDIAEKQAARDGQRQKES